MSRVHNAIEQEQNLHNNAAELYPKTPHTITIVLPNIIHFLIFAHINFFFLLEKQAAIPS